MNWDDLSPWWACLPVGLLFVFACLRAVYSLQRVTEAERDAALAKVAALIDETRHSVSVTEVRTMNRILPHSSAVTMLIKIRNRSRRRVRVVVERGCFFWGTTGLPFVFDPKDGAFIPPEDDIEIEAGSIEGNPLAGGEVWFSLRFDSDPPSQTHFIQECYDIAYGGRDAVGRAFLSRKVDWIDRTPTPNGCDIPDQPFALSVPINRPKLRGFTGSQRHGDASSSPSGASQPASPSLPPPSSPPQS